MDLKLHDNKRVLITGSSSGIGEGIAKALAQEGVVVAVHGRGEKQVHQVAQEIEADYINGADIRVDGGGVVTIN